MPTRPTSIESRAALRRDRATRAFERAVAAVQPRAKVSSAVSELLSGPEGRRWRRLVVVGAGKAVAAMLDGVWEAAVGAWRCGWTGSLEGVVSGPVPAWGNGSAAVVAPGGATLPRNPMRGSPLWGGTVTYVVGGHPVPDDAGVRAARQMLALVGSTGPDDLVVGLLSGGASALMALPGGALTIRDLAETTALLLRSGAPIAEMNAVRTHLSAIGGGRLACVGGPGRVVVLVVSDVVGDDLSVIGSAPFVGAESTFADCETILRRRGIWEQLPPAVVLHVAHGVEGGHPEPPRPGDPCLAVAEHHIVARNLDACRAMCEAVEGWGYRGLLLSHALEGEARRLGVFHAGIGLGTVRDHVPAPPPLAVVTGGEATVTVRGRGLGGRNQETCLAAVPSIAGYPISFLSAGTDGVDGPTAAAGALVDGGSAGRARRAGVDVSRALAENDSGTVLGATGDLVVTGPTGTNVADVRLLLIDDGEGAPDG